jgi:hypothetical protein
VIVRHRPNCGGPVTAGPRVADAIRLSGCAVADARLGVRPRRRPAAPVRPAFLAHAEKATQLAQFGAGNPALGRYVLDMSCSGSDAGGVTRSAPMILTGRWSEG